MPKYQVPAVVGAIKVLKELSQPGDAGATQATLAIKTGMSKSTLHNLLHTLEAHEYVRRDPDTRRYRLGPALIPLGNAALRQVKLVRSTIDRIAPLAEKHHLSFAVAQRTGEEEVQIIERFYPGGDVHVGITIGSTYGPLDGALGKVMLSSMEADHAAKLVEGDRLPAHTKATITSPEALLAEVEEVKSKGWAVSKGELNENNAVAAGIWSQNGDLGLLLLVLGFANQLDDERIDEIGELLHSTAASIMAEAGISV